MCKFAVVFCALVAVASAALLPTEPVPIVRQAQEISPEGNFRTSYETGNGITYEEQGNLKTVGKETPVVSQGTFSYPSSDGSAPIQVSWVADENGFQAQGAHLPVAPVGPEIPYQIARALEWIAAHPYVEPKHQ